MSVSAYMHLFNVGFQAQGDHPEFLPTASGKPNVCPQRHHPKAQSVIEPE